MTPWGWLSLGLNEKRTNQRNKRVAVRRVSLTLRARGGPHPSTQLILANQKSVLRVTLAAHRSSFSSPSRPFLRARGASRMPAGTRRGPYQPSIPASCSSESCGQWTAPVCKSQMRAIAVCNGVCLPSASGQSTAHNICYLPALRPGSLQAAAELHGAKPLAINMVVSA